MLAGQTISAPLLCAVRGVLTSADATPTGTVYRGGVATAVTVTVSQEATGRYSMSFTVPADWLAGERVRLLQSATVQGLPMLRMIDIGEIGALSPTAVQIRAEMETAGGMLDTLPTLSEIEASTVLAKESTAAAIPQDVWSQQHETGYTAQQLMRLMSAVLLGKVSGAGTGTETFRDVSDTKDRVVSTVDNQGNRTNVSKDAS